MFQRIAQFLGLKQSATNRAVVAYRGGRAEWTPADYESLAREGYRKNVVGYRCIKLIADAAAGIEWNAYLKLTRSKREQENHEILGLLRKPSERQSGVELIQSLVSSYLLAGNGYLEAAFPSPEKPAGKPAELLSLRPDRTRVVPGDAINPIGAYEYTANGQTVSFPRQRINGNWTYRIGHWKAFNPLSDWYGMSPLEAAARSVDQNNSSREWNVELLQNHAQPPGALCTKETLTPDQFQRLTEQLVNRSGSASTQAMLLEGGLEWEAFGMTPAEMAWIEGLKLSSREICMAFGVPPELAGDSQSKTYANYQEARKALYEETVLPLMDGLRSLLNAWLVPMYGNDRIILDYNRDDIEALQEDRDKLWLRLEKVTYLTDNEKREAAGYEPYTGEGAEEADKLRKPVQTAPIDLQSTFELTEANESDMAADQQGKAIDRIVALKNADLIDKEQGQKMLGLE